LEIGFGLKEEAKTVTQAVEKTLKNGYRTSDIAITKDDVTKVLGTEQMGQKLLEYLHQPVSI
ncbi:MAG: 3-isopropylmalate dehydrogenase, partial [Sphingobacteriaceae bacterium]